MSQIYRITIKMEFNGGFPVEIELGTDEPMNEVTPFDVAQTIKNFQERGFTAPPRFQKSGSSNPLGKIGEVQDSPNFDATGKMYVYKALLSDASTFEWKDFSRTAYRKGDVIRVIKNDRGFTTAEVLDPDSKEVQEYRAGQPNKNPDDDIPF